LELTARATRNAPLPNALGLAARATDSIVIDRLDTLAQITPELADHPRVILGSGTNVVLHAPIKATALINGLKGKSITPTGELTCASGELWHELVMWSLDQGFSGLENLALIPGTVGAAPVQNIGAYGVELKDLLVRLAAWDFHQAQLVSFTRDQCQFAYRDSIFKQASVQGPWNKPRYFITEITCQLSVSSEATLNTRYADLGEAIKSYPQPITAQDVAQAVICLRQKKLKLLHPDLPQYDLTDSKEDLCKIPAAWLIERCGFKGARRGDAGVHDGHALVIVNHGDANGREILALAQEIQQTVVGKFGVFLEPEPIFMPAI
jgi:UDP-N-acetylmuramate dehydrogenase